MVRVVGRSVDFYQDWVAHASADDPWWDQVHFGKDLESMPPASLLAGWYDLFLAPQLEDFKRLQASSTPAIALANEVPSARMRLFRLFAAAVCVTGTAAMIRAGIAP